MADTITSATSVEGIFSGGDLVLGPATVVEAIGAGKLAAEGIDRYLRGLPQPKMPPVPSRRMRVALTETSASSKMALRRPEMPLLGPERRRITFQQVELGYDEKTAQQEAEALPAVRHLQAVREMRHHLPGQRWESMPFSSAILTQEIPDSPITGSQRSGVFSAAPVQPIARPGAITLRTRMGSGS